MVSPIFRFTCHLYCKYKEHKSRIGTFSFDSMSSQRYQEFIAERTRLLEHIKELENENAELRKRLGALVEPVTSASNDMPDSNDSAKVKEVIFALASTMEGDTTNFYISRRLKQFPDLKMSVIARGINVGDELQYTDEVTLGRSILNRTPL